MMSEIIERVARAIYKADAPRWPNQEPFSTLCATVKERFRAQARAAIESMREPTEEMEVFAAETRACQALGADEVPKIIWQAMIDWILEEQTNVSAGNKDGQ